MITEINAITKTVVQRELTPDEVLIRDSYVAPSLVPLAITMRQAKLALHNNGLLSAVESGIALMPVSSQIEWEAASTVQRNSPLVTALASALGLNSTALDDLFIAGSLL